MQRWKHARRGPKSALVVGILLGVASLLLYQSAYAATPPPYPGYPATPSIPNGPSLGCNPTGTDNATWVCGFNVLTKVTFKVDGRNAGSAEADSNGCVLVVVTFLAGKVSVNGNAPVPVHAGRNFLIVEGFKLTSHDVEQRVGLRLPFVIPNGTSVKCATTPPTVPPVTQPTTQPTTGPSSQGSTTTLFPRRPPGLMIYTTTTRFYPTTLAKVFETPLALSPNKVILESSLLAAVLAAVLSAGALGSIWASGEDGPVGGAAGGTDGGDPPGGGEGDVAAAGPPPAASAPSSGPVTAAPSTPASSAGSAFERPPAPPPTGGTVT